jgi:hypothetical protein
VEEALHQRQTLYGVFEQTAGLVALLRSPSPRFEYVNPAYQAFFPGRLLVGPYQRSASGPATLHLACETRAVVNATLILKVDTRRRAYEARDFSAFQQPTANGRVGLLTIYDEVNNHTSPTWMLVSQSEIVGTQLSSY